MSAPFKVQAQAKAKGEKLKGKNKPRKGAAIKTKDGDAPTAAGGDGELLLASKTVVDRCLFFAHLSV